MSVKRMSKVRRLGSAWERVWDRLLGSDSRKSGRSKPRRLMLDPLEERTLLTVAPWQVDDVLINQVTSNDQDMLYGKSVAVNNNGDFVVVWTRNDLVIDGATGNPIDDPATGAYMTDQNIYARYYTDAVQRINLPADTVGSKIQIEYNGSQIQMISFSAIPEPFSGTRAPIIGLYDLVFINATGMHTAADISFSENDPMETNALNIQTALRNMGVPEYANATVEAIDANNFLIDSHFSLYTQGVMIGQPAFDLIMQNPRFTSSFLPAIDIQNVRQPGWTKTIQVSATDPQITAQNIENAFLATSDNVLIAPVGVGGTSIRTAMPAVKVTARSATEFDVTFVGDSGKKQQPLMKIIQNNEPLAGATVRIIKQSSDEFRVNAPEIQDPTTDRDDRYDQFKAQVAMDVDGDFVITWVGEVVDSQHPNDPVNVYDTDIFARRFSPAGYVQQQRIIIAANSQTDAFKLKTGKGDTNFISFDPAGDLTQLAADVKSELVARGYSAQMVVNVEFRATDEEQYCITILYDNADASSSLLITGWESSLQMQVTDTAAFLSDVKQDLANFGGAGILPGGDGIPETLIQGVRPLGSEFKVNSFTANPQSEPTIGIDYDGNFTIAWASQGQNLSYFNSVQMQRFDRDGNRVGNEVRVNTSDETSINMHPYLAMSHDGIIAVAWENTNDPAFLTGGAYMTTVQAKIYNLQGSILVQEFNVDGGGNPGIDFDMGDNFIVSYEHLTTNDNIHTPSPGEVDVFAKQYQLFDPATGAFSFATIRDKFRINSASFDPTSPDYWPRNQRFAQVGLDADGDLTVSYSGFGPDVSEADIDKLIEGGSQNVGLIDSWAFFGELLVFSGDLVSNGGWFRLTYGDQETADIYFDPTDLPGTATAIETALQPLIPGVTVAWVSDYTFQVTFPTAATKAQRRLIGITSPSSTVAPDPLVATLPTTFVDSVAPYTIPAAPLAGPYSGQSISFTLADPTKGGSFRLTLDGFITGDIVLDPAKIDEVAANIQTELAKIEPNATVVRRAELSFEVFFATAQTPADRPLMTLLNPTDPTKALAGTMSSTFLANLSAADAGTERYNEQRILLTGTSGGWFHLKLGPADTIDIQVDPTNLTKAADDIKAALQAIGADVTLVVCTTPNISAAQNLQFEVFFNRLQTAAVRPLLEILAPSDGSKTPVAAGTATFVTILNIQAVHPDLETFGQKIVFDQTTPSDGWLRLTLNRQITGDIYYNPANPNQVAAAIQAQLRAIEPGAVVIYDATRSEYFVFFANPATAGSRPYITLLQPADITRTPLDAALDVEYLVGVDPATASPTLSYTEQYLPFTLATPGIGGVFRLEITQGSETYTTAQLTFDPNNLTKTAADIEAALANMTSTTDTLDLDAEVYFVSGTQFVVVFKNADTVGNRHELKLLGPVNGQLQASFDASYNLPDYPTLALMRLVYEKILGLGRGEANGAMFSQFDTDPNLATPQILVSDAVANNHRDGQNTRYLLQLDRNAVSGNFTLRVTHDVIGVSVDVVITPVYYPNGGPINPEATRAAIHDAISALSNVGINIPHPDGEGPVQVDLLTYDELNARIDTPWDVTDKNPAQSNPLDINHWIYEITFLGECHDTPMTISVIDSTLTSKASSQERTQLFTFTGDQQGRIILSVGSSTTHEFFINLANPAATALAISTALSAANPTLAGTTCTYAPGEPATSFRVVYPTPQSQTAIVWTNANIIFSSTLEGVPVPPKAVCQSYGFAGTLQYNASLGMTSSGNFVMVWQEEAQNSRGNVTNTNFYFRTFQESTDTVGPLVTDFLLPTTADADMRLSDGDTVRQELKYIVVTFDENMETKGEHSVTNVNNWALMKDGNLVANGITHIDYGMNEAATRLGMPACNKWQAVLTLNGSGDPDTYVSALPDGHYTIVAKTSLRDDPPLGEGNALGRTGFTPNGVVFSREFNVSVPTGVETRVNDATGGDQYAAGNAEIQRILFTPVAPYSTIVGNFTLRIGNFTSASIIFDPSSPAMTAESMEAKLHLAGYTGAVVTVEPTPAGAPAGSVLFSVRFGGVDAGKDQPAIVVTEVKNGGVTRGKGEVTEIQRGSMVPPPQATASNANGDYVVVWSSNEVDHDGIYANIYKANWSQTGGNGHKAEPVLANSTPIPVTPTAGTHTINGQTVPFTDASYASVASDAAGNFVVTWSEKDNGDWNVWACMYDAAGNAKGQPFRVNTTTLDVQRYSNVAMDASGNFVITWQSFNSTTGWDVYAQRYDLDGNTLGGQNEAQLLTFLGRPTCDFTLKLQNSKPDGVSFVTGDIHYQGNAGKTAEEIKAQFEAIGVSIVATPLNASQILIEFIGDRGDLDQPQITVDSKVFTGGAADADIDLRTTAEGATGEFRVNDTTANNQMYPSIAMDAAGDFAITWTSYGQSGDDAYHSNVYVKTYQSSESLGLTSHQQSGAAQYVYDGPSPLAPIQKIISTDSIANHVVAAGTGYDGVVEVDVAGVGGYWMGSGSLLVSGQHILTAAHVVYDDLTGGPAGEVIVYFDLPSGPTAIPAIQVTIHPNYDPINLTNDIAIITLATPAPAAAERYDIRRTMDELTQTIDILGYGATGQGDQGETGPAGTKHFGQNVYELLGEALNGMSYAMFDMGAGTFSFLAGSVLLYDFDNGTAARDAFGTLYGIPDTGLGNAEASSAHGDSGGPIFIDGKIAGITSFGLSPPETTNNADPGNPVFGSISGDTRVSYYASWIDSVLAAPIGSGEIRVNQTTADDQKWSSVAMDADGDFVVTWTDYGHDGGGDGPGSGVNGLNGVYARRFNAGGVPAGGEFLATTFTDEAQQFSKVAMNAAGDFAVVWESFQDRTLFDGTGQNPTDSPDSYGIYGQKYVRTSLIGALPGLGLNGEYEDEFRVNTTQNGDQRYPSIATDANGDFLVVWSGVGEQLDQNDTHGVFMQRFDRPTDTAGPSVINTFDTTFGPPGSRVVNNATVRNTVSDFVVAFSEAVVGDSALGGNSITNLANWSLTRDGTTIVRGVKLVGYDPDTYEATVTFDGDPITSGNQNLDVGTYVLTISSAVQDLYGNALDGDGDGLPGGVYNLTFTINLDGTISGSVWSDLNQDQDQDAEDPGLANWTVWLDIPDATHPTGDGVPDITTTTRPDGSYTFTDVHPGTYYLHQTLKPGWAEEFPTEGYFEVVLGATQDLFGYEFINHDVQGPTVTITPLVTKNPRPILSGTVFDPQPGSEIVEGEVSVLISGQGVSRTVFATVIGTEWYVDLSKPQTGYTPADLPDGTYNILVTAYDTSGNSGSNTTTGDLIVDTVKPTVIVSPLTTNNRRPTITGTVGDASPSSGIASVIVVVGTESVTAVLDDMNWSATLNTPLLDGTYDVKVTVTDNAGNMNSDTSTNELVVDTTKAVVTIEKLTTNDTTPLLKGTVVDPSPTTGIYGVSVTVGGQVIEAILSGTNWTAVVPEDLDEGTYDVQVTALDNAGNTATDATVNELFIDLKSPTVTVNNLTTSNKKPTLTGTVVDPLPTGGMATVSVTLVDANLNTVATLAATITGTTWRATATSDLPDGTYNVRATATDKAGNSAVDTTVGELIVDTHGPAVTVDLKLTDQSKPILTGTVTDPSPGSGIASVIVVVNGQTISATVNGTTWQAAVPAALPDGTYNVQATATDRAGFTATDATTDELIVNTVDPIITVDALETTNTKPTLTGTICNFLANSGTVNVTILVGGQTLAASVDGTNWTAIVPVELANGVYDVRATATNSAGYSATDTTTNELIIDTEGPDITVEPRVTNENLPFIRGTVLDGYPNSGIQNITVTVGGQTLVATIDGIYWYVDLTEKQPDGTFPAQLADGVYDVQVTATDYMGNIAVDTTTNELVVDTVAPTVTVTSLLTNSNRPTLTGTVIDPSPSSGVTQVMVFVGGQTLYAAVNGTNWTATLSKALGDGVYDVQARALDAAGNYGFDATIGELTIDTVHPTDIALSNDRIVEHRPYNTVVGILSSTGPNAGVYTYALLPGAGDNYAFRILGNQLRSGASFDYAAKNTYNVLVRTTDSLGYSFDRWFTIYVVPASQSSSIGDRVWLDSNGNGLQTTGEPGVAGAVVELYCSPSGVVGGQYDYPVAQAVTDADGNYQFDLLLPGLSYYLVARTPNGYTFTQSNVGSDDALDSDVGANGKTALFTLGASADDSRDVGLTGTASQTYPIQLGAAGDDAGLSAATDADGNVYVTGVFSGTVDFDRTAGVYNLTSAGGTDVFLAKYTPTGALVWARSMGGSDNDASTGVAVFLDGSICVSGGFSKTAGFGLGSNKLNITSAGGVDAFVALYDAFGNVYWVRNVGGAQDDLANDVAFGPDGSVYATGYFQGLADFDPSSNVFNLQSVGPKDIFVLKLDIDQGGLVWAKSMGGIGWSQGLSIGRGIAVDASGNVYTTGSFQGVADFDPSAAQNTLACAGASDVFVSKLDTDGNFVWARRMGGSGEEYGADIAIDADGNVYTTGGFHGIADFDPGLAVYNLNSDAYRRTFISKLDAGGNFLWAKGFGGTGYDQSGSIALGNGLVYATGGFEGTADFDPGAGTLNLTSAGNKDVFLLALDSAGAFVGAKRMGGSQDDYGAGVAVSPNGSVYTTGYFRGTADFNPPSSTTLLTSNGGQDAFLAKTGSLQSLTVVINQSPTQADPAANAPVHFQAVFSSPVTGFSAAHLTLGGTAPGTRSAVITPIGADGTTYDIAVSGMTGKGTVTAAVKANCVCDASGNANYASTSADNSVNYGATTSITGVVVAEAAAPKNGTLESNESLVITWAVNNVDVVNTRSLSIDGKAVNTINGPYGGAGGTYYLSATLGQLAAGLHTYTIQAADSQGNSASATGTFTVAAAASIASISGVTVVEANAPKNGTLESNEQLAITWAFNSSNGVKAKSLTIDGAAVNTLYGPYGGAGGTYYLSGVFGPLGAGVHNYTIQTTDNAGNIATANGTFNVVAVAASSATISGVTVVEANAPKNGTLESNEQLAITWAFNSPNGVKAKSLTIDGAAVNTLYGPYGGAGGTYYLSGVFGPLSAGVHNYTIQTTDNAGNIATANGTFNVVAVAASSVTISSVTVVEPNGPKDGSLETNQPIVMTWAFNGANGVATKSLTVDGKNITPINGPYGGAGGTYYMSANLGAYAAGTHSYTIQATDNSGNTATTTGSFTVVSSKVAIGKVVIVEKQSSNGVLNPNEQFVISWQVTGADVIASKTLRIDNNAVQPIYGPYGNYGGPYTMSAIIGPLAAGVHHYEIIVADSKGNSARVYEPFTVHAGAPLVVDASIPASGSVDTLSEEQLQPIVAEAARRLTNALGSQVTVVLDGVKYEIDDLSGATLGETSEKVIRIDRDAAGYGWFVDSTPDDDFEFPELIGAYSLGASKGNEADQRVDLLTTVMHEMEHVLGIGHSSAIDLMYPSLALGTRRQIESSESRTEELPLDRAIRTAALDEIFDPTETAYEED